ncbi:hypothetical protein PIB30_054562 [Stylosanthes scabra]|uniref:Uncharacterized protein n=1 Tax=Stylosanthes scabra TaxID=79078 RepID=A0ABU6TIK3_9FABA|nr:hypothetical protein [Stylosanthes scabra]
MKERAAEELSSDRRTVCGYAKLLSPSFYLSRMKTMEARNWRWKWTIEHENGDGLCLDTRSRDQGSRAYIELGVQVRK